MTINIDKELNCAGFFWFFEAQSYFLIRVIFGKILGETLSLICNATNLHSFLKALTVFGWTNLQYLHSPYKIVST